MIYCIEGPDLAGKSTLFAELRKRRPGLVYVPSMPLTKGLFQHFSDVEARDEALWWALHDPEVDYVTDRHVAISGPVYDRVYKREEKVPWQRWVPHIHVLYLDLPLSKLWQRLRERGDEHFDGAKYASLLQEYEEHLGNFVGTRVQADAPELVEGVLSLLP